MDPKPSKVFPRSDLSLLSPPITLIRRTRNNDTNWTEFGYAVYFNLEELEAQGMQLILRSQSPHLTRLVASGYLSSDSAAPWKRTLQPILKIARKYRQLYVTQWAPSKFGSQDLAQMKGNRHLHETVVRQIIPTRTGLNNIKSTGVVWLWLQNGTEVKKEELVVRKEWTKEDNWTHYPTKRQQEEQEEQQQQQLQEEKHKREQAQEWVQELEVTVMD
jgi:hypothetical protein